MVSGYKHFSHMHKLVMHEMPEGAEVSCSGCNSPATKTVYICWQCNFFLHEQCFQATRSRNHPSHVLHPLTLVPYPTYPSNSFYCNSCKIIGTGFSYSCSECEFDLHVQCAYSISSATNQHQTHLVSSPHPNNTSHPNHEIDPTHLHGQYSSMVHNVAPVSIPIPVHDQYPVSSLHPHNTSYPNQELVPTPLHGQYHSMVPNVAPVSIPTPTHIPSPVPVSIPIPVHAQYLVSSPHTHNISYPNQEIVPPHFHGQNSFMGSNVTTFSIPVSTQIMPPSPPRAQYPTTIVQDSYMTQNTTPFSVLASSQNPITSAQNAYVSQNYTNVNSSIPQSISSNFVPTTVPIAQPSYSGESSQNRPKYQEIKHFSHPHGLVLVNIKHGKKQIACSGCQQTLVGKGYACVEENCAFQLDESCFNLEKEIHHKSHSAHPLALLSSPPYKNQNRVFTCNACFKDGTGFTYHCSICQHDLHVKCANLKETVKRDDHDHELELSYTCPLKGEDYTFYCDVCYKIVPRDHWTYYCKECDYGTHLDCVDREECDETSVDPVVETLEQVTENTRLSAICRQNALDNI